MQDGYRQYIIKMLQELDRTGNGCPGLVIVPIHCIELTLPDIRPIISAPYHAGLKAQEFEET